MNYLKIISQKNQAWANAAKQTVYIEARKLSSSDWDIVDLSRKQSTFGVFAATMPMKVGQFRSEKRDAILANAQSSGETEHMGFNLREGVPAEARMGVAETFVRDIDLLQFAMFKTHTDLGSSEVGKFLKGHERVPYLHIDDTSPSTYGKFESLACSYLVRIGSLPFEVISQADLAQATYYQRRLIDNASVYMADGRPFNADAISKLRDIKLLKPVPLDDVMLTLSGYRKYGTWHISGPVPPEGVVSGFFRTFGKMNFEPS